MNQAKAGETGSARPPVSETTMEAYHNLEPSPEAYGREPEERQAATGPIPDFVRRERDWLVGTAKERSRSLLFQKMGTLAAVSDDVAEVLHSSARKLSEEEDPAMARYFQLAAEGLDRLSSTFRSRDLETMVYRTREFARYHPALFFGTMATAGFMASRFLKSSPEEKQAVRQGRPQAGPESVTASLATSPEGRRQERPYGAVEKPEYGPGET